MSNKYSILLTFDVEDWFQVENFKEYIPFSSWPDYELRVEKNTHCLLDLLDSQRSAISSQSAVSGNSTNSTQSLRRRRTFTPCNAGPACPVGGNYRTGVECGAYSTEAEPISQGEPSRFHPRLPSPGAGGQEETEKKKSMKSRKSCQKKEKIKATFFVLGWIAKRLPHLVREIQTRGHEVASHGYYHKLPREEPAEYLKRDLTDSKKLLEDIIGEPVHGYRAPSFSISNDILNTIADAGYLYDSSYNSFAMHGRYGHVKLSQNGKKGIALPVSAIPASHSPSLQAMAGGRNPDSSQAVSRKSKIFYELPISNLKLGSSILPWGGGAYFRLIPFPLFKMGVRSILKKEGAYLFYMHPWEVDPEQLRVDDAPSFFRFRHYTNLHKTASKLSLFIEGFTNCRFATCRQYLEL